MLIKNGEGIVVDIKAASEILGHADVGITLKIYHHVNAEVIRQVHQEYSPLTELQVTSVP